MTNLRNLAGLLVIFFSFLLLSPETNAQLSLGGAPPSFNLSAKAASQVPTVATATVNKAAMLAEDSLESDKSVPMRFGQPFDVDYNLLNSGLWETLPDGSRLWRLRIESPGAYSINLLYDNFWLPEGARFYIYSSDQTMVIGAFSPQNNKEHGQFATGPIKGDACVLELHIPSHLSFPGEISVSRIVHAYRDIFFNYDNAKDALDFGESGSCNNNVVCPEGALWEEDIRSVAMITTGGGFRLCSGALVNNVREDLTPYFLTANHCLGGESSWIFMFNYESPTCSSVDGPTWMTVSGSTLRATNTYSDFALLELDEAPPDSFNVFYSGWSAIDTPASTSVGIHHPSGDVKKISFNNNPVTSTNYFQMSGVTHWRIDDWEDGTTEPGSSGSPLFDQNHRIVGQLHGGNASCISITDDWYGKFAKSWSQGGTPSSRLSDWLDPDNTGTMTLDGTDAAGVTFFADSTRGWAPLSIDFTGTSIYTVNEWIWDFGDGDSAFVQSPNHVYDAPGIYDVKLEIDTGGTNLFHIRSDYIYVYADTVIGLDTSGGIGQTVEMVINARNNFTISQFTLPVEYGGDLLLAYDSFSVAGCRTDYFEDVDYLHYDGFFKRFTLKIHNATDGSQPELDPGAGPILKLYFTISGSAEFGQTTTVQLDGYSVYLPSYIGSQVTIKPALVPGVISVNGCCVGIRGNIDNDPSDTIDIADLLYLVDYQFGNPPGPAPACLEEGDVDAVNGIDIADLLYLVDYQFGNPPGPAPQNCP